MRFIMMNVECKNCGLLHILPPGLKDAVASGKFIGERFMYLLQEGGQSVCPLCLDMLMKNERLSVCHECEKICIAKDPAKIDELSYDCECKAERIPLTWDLVCSFCGDQYSHDNQSQNYKIFAQLPRAENCCPTCFEGFYENQEDKPETEICIDCGKEFVYEPEQRTHKDDGPSLYEEYMDGQSFGENEPLCKPCFEEYESEGVVVHCSECNVPSIVNPEDETDTLAEIGVHQSCWNDKMNDPRT